MNNTIPSETIERLKQLYGSDADFKTLCNWMAERENDSSETKAERASQVTLIPYSRVVALFRELEDFDCGKLIEGRKGRKTRFSWEYGLRSIGQCAKGMSVSLTPSPDDSDDAIDSKIITHSFQLRPKCAVSVALPADLSTSEAERLALWVKTLPF